MRRPICEGEGAWGEGGGTRGVKRLRDGGGGGGDTDDAADEGLAPTAGRANVNGWGGGGGTDAAVEKKKVKLAREPTRPKQHSAQMSIGGGGGGSAQTDDAARLKRSRAEAKMTKGDLKTTIGVLLDQRRTRAAQGDDDQDFNDPDPNDPDLEGLVLDPAELSGTSQGVLEYLGKQAKGVLPPGTIRPSTYTKQASLTQGEKDELRERMNEVKRVRASLKRKRAKVFLAGLRKIERMRA